MKKQIIAVLAAASIAVSLTGCGSTAAAEPQEMDMTVAKVASLKGATTLGLLPMIDDNQAEDAQFQFAMYTGGDEIVPLIAKGEVDIALIPANLAATLYQKTEGAISVIDINTLSVLEAVTGAEAIATPADLAGHTVYSTGKGTTPEYVLQYLLEQNDAADTVTVEYKAEATEVVSALTEDPTAIGILPQPFATVATMQSPNLKIAFHLGEAWDQTVSDGSRQVTGVTVVRKAFLDEHPQVVQEFIDEHKTSVDSALADPAATATLAEAQGIVKAAVAEKAIPNCGIVCLTGDEMKTSLEGYLSVLYDMAPDAVGGALPDEAFYYVAA